MVTKVAEYCQKREWCSLAKAGRTIYPTMGFLKAGPLKINGVVLLASVTSCKLSLESDDVVIISPFKVIMTFAS